MKALRHLSALFGLLPYSCHGFSYVGRPRAMWSASIKVINDPTYRLRREFVPLRYGSARINHATSLRSNRFDNEYEERASRRAAARSAGKGGGSAAAGAILGAMLGGPFGALFGAQIGANVGSAVAFDKAKEEELRRMGVTKEMLEMAEDCGVALRNAMEGLEAARDSLETNQSYARRLDGMANQLYERAKEALAESEEEKARILLTERHETHEKLKKVLIACAEARKRLEKQESNVAALEDRALEIETLLRRGVGAKSLQDSSIDLSLSNEDPLLKKFRDFGID